MIRVGAVSDSIDSWTSPLTVSETFVGSLPQYVEQKSCLRCDYRIYLANQPGSNKPFPLLHYMG
jgi:hypothetical protein